MDKKRSVINIGVSIAFRFVLLVVSLLVRRFLIKYIGNEANGLDSLFTSIIGFLSVAELGIGSAITFCMYKPIVENDFEKVSALFGLFRKVYLIIGAIILICGCAVMPLLPYLAKGYSETGINIYLTFAVMLISVILSYGFSAEISLINAYKNNYITTAINSGCMLLQYLLQLIVLVLTKSFFWFMTCRIFAVIVQWTLTEIIIRIKYKTIIVNKHSIDSDTKREVVKNVKAMCMHKVGGVLVNTVDSIIISAFIGVVVLGKYSNYTTIVSALMGTVILFFTPITSIIGHLYVEADKETIKRYYNFFYALNFIIGCISFLGYYAVIDNVVTLCFGGGLILSKSVTFVITVNYFIQFMRQSTLLFRDASGTFYHDRWKPLLESLLNLVLSIGCVLLFNYLWGEEIAVIGVIAATIITNLFICHIIEPYVLFKYALKAPIKKFYIKNYICVTIFVVMLTILNLCLVSSQNQWVEFFANGFISIGISLMPCAIVVIFDKNFRSNISVYFKRFKSKFHKK